MALCDLILAFYYNLSYFMKYFLNSTENKELTKWVEFFIPLQWRKKKILLDYFYEIFFLLFWLPGFLNKQGMRPSTLICVCFCISLKKDVEINPIIHNVL